MTQTTMNEELLSELTEVECWTHLVHGTVGRIAYLDPAGPVILSTDYVVQDGIIWIRTVSNNPLMSQLPGQSVAFEVDHHDEHAGTGWSVLVRGRADFARGDDPRASSGRSDPTPGTSNNRSMVFSVSPHTITGHALKRGNAGSAGGHGPGTVQRGIEGIGARG